MKPIFIAGLGAVSPAGWDVAALVRAMQAATPLPFEPIARPGGKCLRARQVPPPAARPAFLGHPRLRRASPITHYAAAAALQAIPSPSAPPARLGLVCCMQSGCVQYSSRFLDEALKDPATASPLAFPETVAAAPTSHLATLLGNVQSACSLVGDPACFLQSLAIAADWLIEGRVDLCVVVGAEESHWITADALWHFEHKAIFSSGAGALCLTANPALSMGVELSAITDAHTFNAAACRAGAASAMRAQLPAGSPGELLCDGVNDSPRLDAPERAAWADWPGRRLSPKQILGEAFAAAAAWQCVLAADAIVRGETPAATVSIVGCNQQAIGACFHRHPVEAAPAA